MKKGKGKNIKVTNSKRTVISGNAANKKPAAKGQSANKKVPVWIIFLLLFMAFTAFEIVFVVNKSIKESKRPEYVTSFKNEFTRGLTSVGEYNDHLYGVDSEKGDIYKLNKTDGTSITTFQLKEGVLSAVENSKGFAYMLDRQNSVQEFTPDNKFKRRISIVEVKAPSWMDIDSDDNFYITDSSTATIVKYDPAFNKVAILGGRGSAKENFVTVGKIFVGPKNELYCMNILDPKDIRVKVLSSSGKFIKEWKITKIPRITQLENLAVAPNGDVYINCYEDSFIYAFGSNGKFMCKFDTDVKKNFLITHPASMTGAKSGLLYVATHRLGVLKPIE